MCKLSGKVCTLKCGKYYFLSWRPDCWLLYLPGKWSLEGGGNGHDTVSGFLTNMTIEGEQIWRGGRRGRRPARSLTGLSAIQTSPWQSFVRQRSFLISCWEFQTYAVRARRFQRQATSDPVKTKLLKLNNGMLIKYQYKHQCHTNQ